MYIVDSEQGTLTRSSLIGCRTDIEYFLYMKMNFEIAPILNRTHSIVYRILFTALLPLEFISDCGRYCLFPVTETNTCGPRVRNRTWETHLYEAFLPISQASLEDGRSLYELPIVSFALEGCICIYCLILLILTYICK